MSKKVLTLFLILFLIIFGNSQQLPLSKFSEISMLTVGPGDNLVDCFGHSAIRVKDPMLQLDLVFNYGMFDFNEPNFYGKFAQGKLLYKLGYSKFNSFFNYYRGQNRSLQEQVLDLTLEEKQQYFRFLLNNAQPENSKYLYDFFYDNCATKLRDVCRDILNDKVSFTYEFTNGKDETLRDLIHNYSYTQPWGTFGIDLALGSVIDRKAKATEYAFLPDYIFKIFKEGKITKSNIKKPIVKKTNTLFSAVDKKSTTFISPLLTLTILALFIVLLTIRDYKRKRVTKGIDYILFIVTGVAGILMILLWFATDHTATASNFNILWAFPLNLPAIYFLISDKRKDLFKYYLILLSVLLMLTIVLWVVEVQSFNIALIPILILLMIRYVYLLKTIR